jgi:predicted regulator of Ras-like GTPase activity (Roadblock/LC7/MglB family)
VSSAGGQVDPDGGVGWLLDTLLESVPGAQRAVMLSNDGLLTARSARLDRDDAERMAAIASGLQSLARGTGQHLGGGAVRQTVVEMDESFLVVTSAGPGACLAVQTSSAVDLGQLAFELNLLVRRVGHQTAMAPRNHLAAVDPSAGGPPAGARTG